MKLEIFIFICDLIIPIIMLFCGITFRNHSPKNINGIYGYRTAMSMKNKDTWEFAHQYCGCLWIKIGLIMLILSIIFSFTAFIFNDKVQEIISLSIVLAQTLALILSIFPVEKELKKTFDENGNRKNNHY